MTGEVRRILVVEDNVALASVVRFNLERSGLSVAIARDGLEAWQLLQQGQFDLAIVDQQMPEMTGVELCQKIRGDARLAGLPLVMLTAKQLEMDLDYLRDQLGVLEVIPKPFSPRELTRIIQDSLSAQVAVDP